MSGEKLSWYRLYLAFPLQRLCCSIEFSSRSLAGLAHDDRQSERVPSFERISLNDLSLSCCQSVWARCAATCLRQREVISCGRMTTSPARPPAPSAPDRRHCYIGRPGPRPNLARLTQGRGQYVTDVVLPRMVHVSFVRSPHAHARIKNIDTTEAKQAPGVIAVVTGTELA